MRRLKRNLVAGLVTWIGLTLSGAIVLAQEAAEPLWVEIPVENHQVAPGRYRIPLHVEEAAGVDRVAEPVRCGVPIPRGVLADAGALRLADENGRERPLQVEPAAYWPDGSHKWVVLDFTADLKPGERKAYTLDLGKGVGRAAPRAKVSVAEDDETITVDTGRLKFTMLKRKNVFINEAWLDLNGDGRYADDERVVAPIEKGEQRGLFIDLYHTKQGTGLYWAALQPKPTEVQVEAAGPLCAEICFKGWHHAEFGRDAWTHVSPRAFQYTLRVRAYAGSAVVRVQHTFVNTEEPLDVRVRAIGIRVPVQVGDGPRCAFGSSPDLQKPGGPEEEYYVVQEHWNSFKFERAGPMPELQSEKGGDPVELLGSYQGSEILKQGKVCERWADLAGRRAGLTVSFRDMETLFPKEICIKGGDVYAYIWPRHKRPTEYEYYGGGEKPYMDLRHTIEVNDPEFARFREKYPAIFSQWMGADSYWARYKKFHDRCNALGVAKTHEIIYEFHPGPVDTAHARTLAAAVSEPIQPFVTPQWYCWETECLGRTHPHDVVNFPKMEAELDGRMTWLYRHQNEWAHWYGLFDYGDIQTFYLPAYVAKAGGKRTGYGNYPFEEFGPWGKYLGRYGWLNGEYNNDHFAFVHYFRTGKRQYFKLASAYAAHHMDVDTCHYHPKPEWIGCQHRHSVDHWSDWLIDQQTYADGAVDLYYTTGDRRARDVALEVAGYSMLAQIPFRYFQETTEGDEATVRFRPHRGTWNKITSIARAYEMTRDPEMRRHLDAWLRVFKSNWQSWGGFKMGSTDYLGSCLPLVYYVTDSPLAKRLIMETNFAGSSYSNALGNFAPYSALRWRLTQDTGPFVATNVWGIAYDRRRGSVPDEWKEVRKDSFRIGRLEIVGGLPFMMSAVYDARYDDRARPGSTKQRPWRLPDNTHCRIIDLRARMNADPFGDMPTGKGLPWPAPGAQLNSLDQTLGLVGGKVVFCGSGTSGHKADQNITHKIQPGELGLTCWTMYPSYEFEPPMTRGFHRVLPAPATVFWGAVPFEIADPKLNKGHGMIAVKGGESVTVLIGLTAKRLYFLGHVYALRYDKSPGMSLIGPVYGRAQVGRYRLTYEDGTTEDVAIANRVNASRWRSGVYSTEAPPVRGGTGGGGWPGSGMVCEFDVPCRPKKIRSVEISGADPDKALMLFAVTALVDGAPPLEPTKTIVFGAEAKAPEGGERVEASTRSENRGTGWLDPAGVRDLGAQVQFLVGEMRTLRVALPDGWYRCDAVIGTTGPIMNLVAGGRLVLRSCAPGWGPQPIRFCAEAEDGAMDLTFVSHPWGQNNRGGVVLRSVAFSRLPRPPAVTAERVDLARCLRYGWDGATADNRYGALFANTFKMDVPPGTYRVAIKFTMPYYGSPKVTLDITAQGKRVVNDHLVSARGPATFDVTVAKAPLAMRIAVDPDTSSGRIRQWAIDRMTVERIQ